MPIVYIRTKLLHASASHVSVLALLISSQDVLEELQLYNIMMYNRTDVEQFSAFLENCKVLKKILLLHIVTCEEGEE